MNVNRQLTDIQIFAYTVVMAAYKWRWTAPILRDTLPTLQEMAARLGFIVTGNNAFTGNPAPADMLDALAAVYRLDPAGTLDALRALLAPPSADATPPDA